MRILVTGGRGFIGHALSQKLRDLGHEVIVFDNGVIPSSAPKLKYIEYYNENAIGIEFFLNAKSIDLCYHLAALSRIQPSFSQPHEYFLNNLISTEAICEWAYKGNVKVIYAGSSSQWQDPFLSPYALYKKMAEDLGKLYKNIYGLNFEVARFYNVYGHGESIDQNWGAVIGLWRNYVKQNKPLPIVGDGTQKRDFTHIDDIVDGLIKIGLSNQKHEDAWELGSGFEYSINEVAQAFVEKFKCEVEYIDNQRGNYKNSVRANDDAVNRLDWHPKDYLFNYINNL